MIFDAGDERPDSRDVDLLDHHRPQLGLRQERRQIEIRLEADVHGERRDQSVDERPRLINAAEASVDTSKPAISSTGKTGHFRRATE